MLVRARETPNACARGNDGKRNKVFRLSYIAGRLYLER